MVSVEKLYELYNIIAEAKGDAKKHEAEYKEILGGVKGDIGARKITAQFISRYFNTFPEVENESLDALFDLCEDDDSNIRRQSITSLGVVCKGVAKTGDELDKLVSKVADILAQLLQVEDPAEINCVNASLVSLLRISSKGALTGLFYQVINNASKEIKERILRFLLAKIPALTSEVFTKEVQCFILQKAKTIIPALSETELDLLMQVLNETAVCRTNTAQQQLHDVLVKKVDLTKPLEIKPEAIVTTISILTLCKRFYGSHIKSTTATTYVLTQVLPHLEAIEAALLVTGKPEDAAVMLTLLQLIASLIPTAEKIEEPKAAMEHIHKALLNVLPVPPTSGAPGWEAEGGANLQFSRVECLLYSLQQLTKSCTDFFSDEEALKDFRQRLTYFSRGCQAYQKVLRDSIKDKKGEELKTEESKTILIALKTTANITSIVKDFFHNPPAAKSTITLSWLLDSDSAASKKRPAEAAEETKTAKVSRQIYAPPKDKYSRGTGYNSTFRGGRGGRGRGGRGFRRY